VISRCARRFGTPGVSRGQAAQRSPGIHGQSAQHRIGLGNKDQQIAFQLIERHLLTAESLCCASSSKRTSFPASGFRNFYTQQFIETLLAFRERE
jgi:hypothetical protein